MWYVLKIENLCLAEFPEHRYDNYELFRMGWPDSKFGANINGINFKYIYSEIICLIWITTRAGKWWIMKLKIYKQELLVPDGIF